MSKYFNFDIEKISPSQVHLFDKEIAKIRLLGVQAISFLILIFTPILAPLQFKHLYQDKGQTVLYWYISYVILIMLVSAAIFFVSRYYRAKEENLIFYANFMFYFLMFWTCQGNLVVSFVGIYYGSDILSVIIAPSVFSTIFFLTRQYRLWLLISYYCVVIGVISLMGHHTFFQMLDKGVSLFGIFLLYYIVADFLAYSWHYEKKRQFENVKTNQALALKTQQQEDTFYAVLNAINSLSKDPKKEVLPKDINLDVKERTFNLISEFTKTQHQFNETLKKYEDIFENVNDGILILDQFGRIKDINKAGKIILEIEDSSFQDVSLEQIVYEEDRAKSKIYLDMLINEGEYKGYEGRIVTSKGNIKHVEVNSTAIYQSGIFAGSRDIIRDITERKNAEEEIFKARNSEKQFLANMSHEIRTPLNAIIGMSHLLFDTKPNADQIEYLNIIKNSSNFLLSLISDILDMSKIEAGKMELNLVNFDLWGLLKTIEKTFVLKLERKPIKFTLDLDEKIKGVWLADKLILNQILFNIVSNAEKFTERGEIKLQVKVLKSTDKDKQLLEFSVSDTGIGMPTEKLDLIFQKFTQIHEKKSQKQQGTGLGLALCKEFVEMQNGNITAESTPNVGTKICFVIPLTKISDLNSHEVPEPNKNIDSKLGSGRILVAEDNKFNRLFVEKVLIKNNLTFDFALDGNEAIEKAQTTQYSLILMDIEMPILDGFEATIAIRNTENINQFTPIIALTASALSSIKENALHVGMNGFLSKPFTPDQLNELLNEFVCAK